MVDKGWVFRLTSATFGACRHAESVQKHTYLILVFRLMSAQLVNFSFSFCSLRLAFLVLFFCLSFFFDG